MEKKFVWQVGKWASSGTCWPTGACGEPGHLWEVAYGNLQHRWKVQAGERDKGVVGWKTDIEALGMNKTLWEDGSLMKSPGEHHQLRGHMKKTRLQRENKLMYGAWALKIQTCAFSSGDNQIAGLRRVVSLSCGELGITRHNELRRVSFIKAGRRFEMKMAMTLNMLLPLYCVIKNLTGFCHQFLRGGL